MDDPIEKPASGAVNRFWGLWPYLLGGWLVLTVPLAWWVLRSTQPARSAGHTFLNALRDRDYTRAFGLCAPNLQRRIGGEGRLRALVEGSKGLYCPSIWTSVKGMGDSVELKSVDRSGGAGYSANLWMVNLNGTWKVSAWRSVTPEGFLDLPGPVGQADQGRGGSDRDGREPTTAARR